MRVVQMPRDCQAGPLLGNADGGTPAARRELLQGWGVGGDTEAHFPNPPPRHLLVRRAGRGGSAQGVLYLLCRGRERGDPTTHGSK